MSTLYASSRADSGAARWLLCAAVLPPPLTSRKRRTACPARWMILLCREPGMTFTGAAETGRDARVAVSWQF